MHIYSNSTLFAQLLPGIAHRTLAGPEHGLRALEVWSQRIDANAATPPHRHDCEEVVVVLEGEGTLSLRGTERHFQSGDTLILLPTRCTRSSTRVPAPCVSSASSTWRPCVPSFPTAPRSSCRGKRTRLR